MVKTEKNPNPSRISFFSLFFLVLIFLPGTVQVFSQPVQQEETVAQVRLEDVNFRVREIGTPPSSLTLLEVHVSVFNPSKKVTVPPNSIKLAIVPKEVTFLDTPPKDQPDLQPEITTLNFHLAPMTGRILITAFSLPMEAVESITFDIQVNPPEGEKRTATWRRK
ncbi:MAG: hypothetical protein A2162_05625 [Deltaproteobacteria bacterium RBG_13_52_11b]|nr:MAG: hypothetical protein A2162_05625 [Deltaproteobacteria bacterium RBG_13_52_11b]